MNLGKPEAIGAVDDDGVGRGYIDAAFDDRGAYQHVEAAMIEIQHELFQLTFAHLAMPHRDVRLGDEFADGLRGLLDGLDGVMDEIDLTAAANLAHGRFPHHGFVPLQYEGLHRETFGRRSRDER